MADNIIWPGIVQSSAQNTPAVIRATDNAGIYTLLVNGLFDPAATAFFAAAGITNATQKSAINTLVLGLKSATLWNTRLEIFYPFVGGSESSNSFNLIDPSYKPITWAGGMTFNDNGVTGNGTDAWGDTDWDSANALLATQNSISIYAYCRTQSPTDGGRFLGTSNTAGNSRIGMVRTSGTLSSDGPHDADSASAPQINTVTPDFRGSMMLTRTGAAAEKLFIRAITPTTTTNASISTCTGKLAILARNFESFGADSFSNANLAAVAVGNGFSDADYATIDALVTEFQTTLGRNV